MSNVPQFEPLERRLLLSSSPALSGWLLTSDTAPALTFTFTESIFGTDGDVAVLDPGSGVVTPSRGFLDWHGGPAKKQAL